MHQHMLPLINSAPSEFALRFESRLCISKVISHHIVPPTCVSRQPYLRSQSAALPPRSASILASPQRPHNLPYTHARTRPHRHTNLCTCHPPTRRFSPILSAFPRSPVFSPHSRHRLFPRGQDFLQSLELINSKVAANDKLWEKGNKLEMHQCLSWPGMGPPPPPCPAAFRPYMCSHVSSDLYSLKQAFKAGLLTKAPGDIFKFSLVA